MTRRSLLSLPLFTACAERRETRVADWAAVRAAAQPAPSLLYFWALWSRPSVELLPTLRETALEYPALRFAAVCLADDPAADQARAASLAESLGGAAECLVAPLDFDRLTRDFGVSEPPAAVVYARENDGPARLEGEALTPDRLDAFAAEAAAIMTTSPRSS